MCEHWFWFGLTLAAIAWYTFITGYVAVKGVADIKNMLKELSVSEASEEKL